MRQPKFRGFSPETNEWVYGYGWHETDYTDDFLRSINQSRQDAVLFTKTFPITCDIESMGEFTGLLDTNGVEIYEGDIVQVKYTYEQGYLGGYATEEVIGQVEYKHGCFDVYKNNVDQGIVIREHISDLETEWEVIGNIFEDGELLNDSNHPETD
ncbi:YopX family protein [Robertmurraya siralis]|uniref:YopX family protein n=1 Tax=Robertmurraya siralis TaxID=77777 RepID=UPI0010F613B8|nr:YopX family protein [Robertmurraya siralis]